MAIDKLTCVKCGFENGFGCHFCVNCGEKFQYSCPQCGNNVAPGNKFCDNCGTSLDWGLKETASAISTIDNRNREEKLKIAPPSPVKNTEFKKREQKENRKTLPWIIGIVFIIVCIIVIFAIDIFMK